MPPRVKWSLMTIHTYITTKIYPLIKLPDLSPTWLFTMKSKVLKMLNSSLSDLSCYWWPEVLGRFRIKANYKKKQVLKEHVCTAHGHRQGRGEGQGQGGRGWVKVGKGEREMSDIITCVNNLKKEANSDRNKTLLISNFHKRKSQCRYYLKVLFIFRLITGTMFYGCSAD